MVAALAVVGLLRVDIDTRASSFVPGDDPTVEGWNELQRAFGGDPIVALVASPDERGLLAPGTIQEVLGLEGRFAGLDDVAVVYGPGTILNQIAGQAQDVILELTAQRDALRAQAETEARDAGLNDSEIAAAGAAAVEDFDLRYGTLLIEAVPAGLPTLNNGAFAEAVALFDDGSVRPSFSWVLPDRDHGAIYIRPREGLSQDEISDLVDAVDGLVADSALADDAEITGSPVIAAGLADQIRADIPALAGASVAAVALAFLLVGRGSLVRRLVPLAYGLAGSGLVLAMAGWSGIALSIGVLAFLPTILGVGTDFPIYALDGRLRHVAVAAVAAAVGFASMAASPVPFVRQYGLLLAAGVLATTALAIIAVRRRDAADDRQRNAAGTGPQDLASARRAPVSVDRRVRLGLGALGVIAALGWATVPGQGIETRPQALAEGVEVLDGAERAEAALGASGEMVVRLQGTEIVTAEVLDWFRRAEQAIVTSHGDQLRPIITPDRLLAFLGPEPTSVQITAALDLVPGYLLRSIITPDRSQAIASFGLRLGDLEAQRDLVDDVRTLLPDPPAGTTVTTDGLPVVAARAVDLLSGRHVLPSVLGIAGFGLVVAVGLRDKRAWMLGVASAAVSTGIGALVVTASGRDLSPLSLSLGSLAVAVGGEFALVIRERIRSGSADPYRPVFAATVTSVAGFAVLAASSLEMLREFAVVLTGSVVIAAGCGAVLAWATTSVPLASVHETDGDDHAYR